MQCNWRCSIFVLAQLLGNHVASKEVILGHFESGNFEMWRTYESQFNGNTSISSTIWNPRDWQVCDYSVNTTEPSNWLRNNQFAVKEANTVYITVEYSIANCSSLPGPQKQYCKDWLSLHVYRADSLVRDQIWLNPVFHPDFYEKITDLPATNAQRTTKSIPLQLRKRGKYFTIAFHDQGSCTTLYSVKIHYFVCPGGTLNSSLITLPETVAPANNAASIRVNGGCTVQNSVKTPGSLVVMCESNGEWNTSGIEGGCVCKEGTEKLEEKCKFCSEGQFNDLKSSTCIPCPANSLSPSERTRCECKPTFYRAQWESIREDCTGVPSAPRLAIASFVNQTAVVLQWYPPGNNGGRNDVLYEVECHKPCVGTDCVTKPCRNDVKYFPNKECVNGTKIIVTNLFSFVTYTFIIYAKNGVSAVARTKDSVIPHSATLYIRTNGTVPGQPTLQVEKLSDSSVRVSWTLHKKNGIIQAYYVHYKKENSQDEKTITAMKTFVTVSGFTPGRYIFVVIPGQPTLQVEKLSDSSVRVSWTLHKKNGIIQAYYVHYKKENSQDEKTITAMKTFVTVSGFTPGRYIFVVTAENHVGKSASVEATVTFDANDAKVIIAVIAVGAMLLAVVLVVPIVCLCRKQNQNLRRQERNNFPEPRDQMERDRDNTIALVERPTPPGVQNDALYRDLEEVDSFELRRDKIEFQKLLGSGSFGEVFKAVIRNRIVAVKCLKENALAKDKEDLQTELNVMKQLEPHPHVVQLIGCCSCNGPLLIVLEYLTYGDLLGYLRKSRGHKDNYNTGEKTPKSKLTPTDLLSFAWMIADGMSYLAEMKVVHRDLAARNVLVGENKVCKISDFGLARGVDNDIYMRQAQARLPVKWMPPESVFHGLSSTMSDVWSYGILLWEVFTIGDSPYPGIDANRVASLLESGYRMTRPLHISEELFAIMSECWSQKPEDRPSFNWIRTAIKRLQKDKKICVNLDLFKDEDYVNFDMFNSQ